MNITQFENDVQRKDEQLKLFRTEAMLCDYHWSYKFWIIIGSIHGVFGSLFQIFILVNQVEYNGWLEAIYNPHSMVRLSRYITILKAYYLFYSNSLSVFMLLSAILWVWYLHSKNKSLKEYTSLLIIEEPLSGCQKPEEILEQIKKKCPDFSKSSTFTDMDLHQTCKKHQRIISSIKSSMFFKTAVIYLGLVIAIPLSKYVIDFFYKSNNDYDFLWPENIGRNLKIFSTVKSIGLLGCHGISILVGTVMIINMFKQK